MYQHILNLNRADIYIVWYHFNDSMILKFQYNMILAHFNSQWLKDSWLIEIDWYSFIFIYYIDIRILNYQFDIRILNSLFYLNEQWWMYNSCKNRLTCVSWWIVVESMIETRAYNRLMLTAWAFYLSVKLLQNIYLWTCFSTEVYHFIITMHHHKAYK